MSGRQYCGHGMSERRKLGVTVESNGVEVCNGCRLTVFETVPQDMDRASARSAPILMLTMAEAPGYRVTEILGLVEGVGHPGYQGVVTTTATRGQSALNDAKDDLERAARIVGANAVLGIVLSSYSGGNRSVGSAMGVHLLGTAVVLARKLEPDAGTAVS